ncbi:hypothetical protein ACIU1J_06815 [Azospirillum doebereinerae]|uniref:hypothetical protein n=1 Tax=Azospirillum doebereinerae TaxID=92933 RepID=UPI001EE54E7A|nr:hypothetical protein [Azospirillum doebereinerae]MCG5239177.1 hypothetical protein [Azospirillum doebereinerae]
MTDLSALAGLARGIDRAATAGDAAILRAQAMAVGLPRGREPALPLEVLALYAPADVRDHLWTQFGDGLEPGFPTLCGHLLAVVADPGAAGAPDAVTTAEALAALARRHGANRTVLRDRLERTALVLADRARRSTDHLQGLLEAPDFPDLRTISLDVLRIEGVRWVLEILGQRSALTALSNHGRRLSRLTLSRSAMTIRAFVGKPDLLALYDNLAVISQVDNLLTVAARLLDALKDREEERTHFVTPDDETALHGFGGALVDLAEMLARIALKSVGRPDVTPELAASALEQMRFLHQLADRLGTARPAPFDTLDRALRRCVPAIAERFKTEMEKAPPFPAGAGPHPLETQARALARLLTAIGPSALAAD